DATDEDGVISLFDSRLEGALEEGEGQGLLAPSEHVQREGLRLLDERVRVRVRLHTDDDQRRLERDLRHPVDGGGGHATAALVRRREDVQAVRNQSEARSSWPWR